MRINDAKSITVGAMTAPRGAIPENETTRRVFTALTVSIRPILAVHSVANAADGPEACHVNPPSPHQGQLSFRPILQDKHRFLFNSLLLYDKGSHITLFR